MRWAKSDHTSLGWRCSLCDPDFDPAKHLSADDPPEAELWLMRNCHAKRDHPPLDGFEDFAPELNICPRKKVDNRDWYLIDLWWRWTELGLLPYPGTLWDQPQWVVEVLEACNLAGAENRRISDERERRERIELTAWLKGRSHSES